MSEFQDEEIDEAPSADAAPTTSDVPQPGIRDVPSLDELLAEYDSKVKPEAEKVAEPDAVPGSELERSLTEYQIAALCRAGISANSSDAEVQAALAGDALLNAYDATKEKLIEFANSLEHQRDWNDFKETLASVREAVGGDLSDEMIAAYLMFAHRTDERVANAWDGRYDHPTIWHNRLGQVVAKLSNELSQRIDPDATADHAAVTWAVRNSGRRASSSESSMPLIWATCRTISLRQCSPASAWILKAADFDSFRAVLPVCAVTGELSGRVSISPACSSLKPQCSINNTRCIQCWNNSGLST